MTMDQKSRGVKSRRRYDSSGRRERARQTRDQIIDVARELFLARGYGSTTVAAVAAAAHVSVETIYKSFGGKPGLVRAIIEKGLAGEGPVPAEQRSDHIRDTEPDPRKILTAWGAFTAELGPQVIPIFTLARDAAGSDPDMAVALEQISAARYERMTVNARGLARAGHLRAGMTPEQAADILWTYCSPELADLLVTRLGWPAERYGAFIAQALIAALLPGEST
jgi:AcrR family transcriptional regulator